jgi:hypothetical protein
MDNGTLWELPSHWWFWALGGIGLTIMIGAVSEFNHRRNK